MLPLIATFSQCLRNFSKRVSRLAIWQDTSRTPEERVDALVAAMTLREKVAQLYGLRVGTDPEGTGVAPHQTELENGTDYAEMIKYGLGQLTRVFGTRPVDPGEGAAALIRAQ